LNRADDAAYARSPPVLLPPWLAGHTRYPALGARPCQCSEARERNSADQQILEPFAHLHDSCRLNEGRDPQYGSRAAKLVRELQGPFYQLSPEKLDRLAEACVGHTHQVTHFDITIATCWDADRLDLGSVGIEPDPAIDISV
jgi:hypothetical protein